MQKHFNPPYDSPLEELFAWNLAKYIADDAILDKQVSITTRCGEFRPDFVVTVGGEKIAFECDGAEFHEGHRGARDEWRDAAILQTGAVDAIYRLRGRDLFHHMEDCLYVIANWDAGVFSRRGHANLFTLSSENAKSDCADQSPDDRWSMLIGYGDLRHRHFLSIERRTADERWISRLIGYMKTQGGNNLDRIIETWRREHGFPIRVDQHDATASVTI